MIKVISKNRVPAENTAEFKRIVALLVAETVKEAGCVEYALFEDEKDPEILVFVETWETRDHLEAHFEAPHFKLYVPQLGTLRTDKELTILKSL
jgi:quinol monooxygenase YgiN